MTSHEHAWLATVITASLAIRLLVAGSAFIVRQDASAFHVPDTARYLALGRSLVERGSYTYDDQPETFRLPGFPLLVGAATLTGAPTGGTLIIHALLGALTTWLCFIAGRQVGGARVGLWAATLYAIEPGQWAWSTMIASETLFTALTAGCLAAAVLYLRNERLMYLLLATAAACGAAYVRFIGYLLPAVLLVSVFSLGRRAGNRVPFREVSIAALLAIGLLSVWHVRNGMTTGYWGFSVQLERAIFFMGRGTIDARESATSYADAIRKMPGNWRTAGDAPPPPPTGTMRRDGLASVLEHPFTFASSYAAGVGTMLLHPGTAVVMRPFRSTHTWDGGQPSASQMLTLGLWERARGILEQKGLLYWLLTVPLGLFNLLYLLAASVGGWKHRRDPAIKLACVLLLYFAAFSGGPDADSRRRVPMVPILSVLAATALVRNPSSDRDNESRIGP